MGNYEQLKQSVSDVIKTNGNKEITGSILQNVLLTIISTVGANATFAGIATPTTNPGTPDGSVFYLASEGGTYPNFGNIELQDGLSVLMWNGSWSGQQIFSIDDVPTSGSDNLVKSGGVFNNIGAIDVSELNATENPHTLATYEDLTSALNALPTSYRKGGMMIKFVQSTDNKYVQFRLMSDTFNTNPSNWQGVDDEPVANSKNLVKSGGVYDNIIKNKKDLKEKITSDILRDVQESGVYFTDEQGRAFLIYTADGFDTGKLSDHFNSLVNPKFASNENIKNVSIVYAIGFDDTDKIPAMSIIRAIDEKVEKQKLIVDISENIVALVANKDGKVAVSWSPLDGFDVNAISGHFTSLIKQISDESLPIYSIEEEEISIVTDSTGQSAVSYNNNDGLRTRKINAHETGYDLNTAVKNSYVKDMEEWRDLGFGMMIHWGLYSILAGHYTGYNRSGEYIDQDTPGEAEAIFSALRIPKDTYIALKDQFTAANWDAEAVARLAYDAGMKYIVITEKHAEGFHLYPTALADVTVADTPAPNTIYTDLKNACDKYGLKFCMYFNQQWGCIESGGYGSYYVEDDTEHSYTDEEHREWVEKEAQILIELCSALNPYAIWFDTGRESTNKYMKSIINTAREKYFPQAIINDRLYLREIGDYGTGEGAFYDGTFKYAENAYSLGYWGYYAARDVAANTKPANVVLCSYVLESAARNQNVILNVGPKGDGSIPDLRKNQLVSIGNFFSKYGTIAGYRGVNQYAMQNWGVFVKKENLLRCFVMKSVDTIKIDGVLTKFILDVKVYGSNNASYEVTSDEEVVISGVPTTDADNMPRVIDIYFGSNIVSNDYIIITNTYKSIDILSFYKFIGCDVHINPVGVSMNTSWTAKNGYIKTRFKSQLDSDTYTGNIGIQSGTNTIIRVTIKDLSDNATQTADVDTSISTTFNLSLTKGHIYDLTLTKTSSTGWINCTGITIN